MTVIDLVGVPHVTIQVDAATAVAEIEEVGLVLVSEAPGVEFGVPGLSGQPGPSGASGPSGPSGPIGPPGVTFRGLWDWQADYVPNDLALYGGAEWIALTESTNLPCPDHPEAWALFVDRGQPGPQGASGPSGPSGPQGATGPTGPQGASGPSGVSGPIGTMGSPGSSGLRRNHAANSNPGTKYPIVSVGASNQGWNMGFGGATIGVVSPTDPDRPGVNDGSIQVTTTDSYGSYFFVIGYDKIPIPPELRGSRFSISLWVKPSVSVPVFNAYWLDQRGSMTSSGTTIIADYNGTVVTSMSGGTWYRVIAIAPTELDSATLGFRWQSSPVAVGSKFNISGLLVEPVGQFLQPSQPADFFSGDSLDAIWEGTPGNSTSLLGRGPSGPVGPSGAQGATGATGPSGSSTDPRWTAPNVLIGQGASGATGAGDGSITIGMNAQTYQLNPYSAAIGRGAKTTPEEVTYSNVDEGSLALGTNALASHKGSTAIGRNAKSRVINSTTLAGNIWTGLKRQKIFFEVGGVTNDYNNYLLGADGRTNQQNDLPNQQNHYPVPLGSVVALSWTLTGVRADYAVAKMWNGHALLRRNADPQDYNGLRVVGSEFVKLFEDPGSETWSAALWTSSFMAQFVVFGQAGTTIHWHCAVTIDEMSPEAS